MERKRFAVILEWEAASGLWVSHVPTLNGLSTFGATREEALAMTQEAIQGYLEALQAEGLPPPGGRVESLWLDATA